MQFKKSHISSVSVDLNCQNNYSITEVFFISLGQAQGEGREEGYVGAWYNKHISSKNKISSVTVDPNCKKSYT